MIKNNLSTRQSIGNEESNSSNEYSLRSSFCRDYSITSLDHACLTDTEDEDEALQYSARSDFDELSLLDEYRVSFGDVEIREFPVTVDDRPKCIDSCPLTLTWEPLRTIKTTVDECERIQERRQPVRSLSLHERRMRISETQAISLKEVTDLEMATLMDRITGLARLSKLRTDRTSVEQGKKLDNTSSGSLRVA